MTAPTRLPPAPSKEAVPSVAADIAVQASPDLAQPRPVLMDRLHFARAGAADVQKTLGNRIAQRVAQEKEVAGEAPRDGSAPRRDADARGKDRAPQPHADEPTGPPLIPSVAGPPPELPSPAPETTLTEASQVDDASER